MSQPAFWVVIPAAGVGSRMRADRPKQYLQVAGRCIIEHTLDCFLDHPTLAGLVVCVAADDPYWPGLPAPVTHASSARLVVVSGATPCSAACSVSA